ncbi:hypothetical protein LSAT2_008951 [Lamellibrachia satsuma]|nr:hypothetical protein LSAT2_008951 [Lamellibrachia satsuma]
MILTSIRRTSLKSFDAARCHHRQLSPGCQCVVTHQSTTMEEDTATEQMSSDEVDSQAEVRDSAIVSDIPTDMLEINSLSLADSVNNYIPRCMMERINNNDPSLLDEMRYERCRLVTYANWPRDTNIEPEALAQAGLFYLCRADRVKCAFCYGILHNWEPSEEPMTKHCHLFLRLCLKQQQLVQRQQFLRQEMLTLSTSGAKLSGFLYNPKKDS